MSDKPQTTPEPLEVIIVRGAEERGFLRGLEAAAKECERWYYDLDEPASFLNCADSIRRVKP